MLNSDIRADVFIDGNAVVLKQELWHELGMQKCKRKGADATFAIQCAEGNETTESTA